MNRPPVNAWDHECVVRLGEVQDEIESNPNIDLVRVGSELSSFSAGGDIRMMVSALERGDTAVLAEFAVEIQRATRRWRQLPKLTVAVLSGAVFGGGLEFALACDLRIAFDDTSFGFPEVNLGLVPAGGGTQFLTELVGRSEALRMMVTGEAIGANRALDIGLVHWVVPANDLPSVDNIIAHLLSKSSIAQSHIKRCVNLAGTEQGFSMETTSQADLYNTRDSQERMFGFFSDRHQHGRVAGAT